MKKRTEKEEGEAMKFLKLKKDQIEDFFDSIHSFGIVYAPVKSDGKISFRRAQNFSDVSLEYTRSQIPPKHVILPMEEPILKFREEEYFEVVDDENKVLLGVHHCDIIAFKMLDEVYLQPPKDIYYHERIKRTLIIGLSCIPDNYCFCKATNSFYTSDGFDIFLHDCGDFYFVRVATPRGLKVTENSKNLFEKVDEKDMELFVKAEKERFERVKGKNLWMIGDLIELRDENFWKIFSERCLNCGNCTLVCPTCQCFEVYDELEEDLKSGNRFRRWDSCMLRAHGLVADGHNFRERTEERLRNRLSCKLGEMRCVGCGRCTVYCPTGIDILEIVRALKE